MNPLAAEKYIHGYGDHYRITEDGRVWSRYKDDYLKPVITEKGYLAVDLRKDGHRFKARIHRLVAEAFIPNPNNLSEVNHKDGDKTNNVVGNLEWCTHSDNVKHAYQTGLEKVIFGAEHHRSKLTQNQAEYIRKMYKKRDPVFGGKALAQRYSVSLWTIMNVVRGVCYRNGKEL